MRRIVIPSVLAALAALAGGCDTDDGRQLQPTLVPPTTSTSTTTTTLSPFPEVPASTDTTAPPADSFVLVAPWTDGEPIPARYTCDGEDLSPAISWIDVPEGTVELALVVIDDAAGGFVHWAAAGIDPNSLSVPEDVAADTLVEAINDFGNLGWGGPCPPVGDEAHPYRFTLYALGQQIELPPGGPGDELIGAIEIAALKSSTLFGRYQR